MNYFLIGIACLCILMTSCQQQTTEQTESTENTQNPTSQPENESAPKTLTTQLEERVTNFREKAAPEKVRSYEDAIQKVAASGILESSKKEGDMAINFSLPNANGNSISLFDQTKEGYVILNWYRGGWCPYCNLTLAAWQDILPELEQENIKFIAISPELPDSSLSTKEKNALQFEVLSDKGNQVAKQYGIVFELDDSIKEAYKQMGLENYNGDNSYTLPLSATYVINSENKIVYAFLDADYRKRAEPRDVLAKVKQMKQTNR